MSDEFLPKPFQCDVATSDGTARVRPAGELDMSTVRVLEQRLTELHAAGGAGSWSISARWTSWTPPG